MELELMIKIVCSLIGIVGSLSSVIVIITIKAFQKYKEEVQKLSDGD